MLEFMILNHGIQFLSVHNLILKFLHMKDKKVNMPSQNPQKFPFLDLIKAAKLKFFADLSPQNLVLNFPIIR